MRKPAAGFTLIEVLIVVAILLLLLGLISPALVAARELAQMGACADHMRGLALALLSYCKESSALPGNVHDASAYQVLRVVPASGATSPYALDKQVIEGVLYTLADKNRQPFVCPTYASNSRQGGTSVAVHYAIPTILSGCPVGNLNRAYYDDPDGTRQYLRGVPMIVEPMVRKNADNTWNNYLGTYNASQGKWSTLPDGAFEQGDRLATRRHMPNADESKGKTNIAFQDGHVDSVYFKNADIQAEDITIELNSGGSTWTKTLGGTNSFNAWIQ